MLATVLTVSFVAVAQIDFHRPGVRRGCEGTSARSPAHQLEGLAKRHCTAEEQDLFS